MKSNRINSGLTLASNIGVVIGLFLVAYQINQETESTSGTATIYAHFENPS